MLGRGHGHKDRPGTVYILQGIITDHRNGVATDYGPGVGWPEDGNTTYWLENTNCRAPARAASPAIAAGAGRQGLNAGPSASADPART